MQGGSPDDMIVSTDMIHRYDDALIRGDGWMDTSECHHLLMINYCLELEYSYNDSDDDDDLLLSLK